MNGTAAFSELCMYLEKYFDVVYVCLGFLFRLMQPHRNVAYALSPQIWIEWNKRFFFSCLDYLSNFRRAGRMISD